MEESGKERDGGMKVLLINGSPHERGCTYTALHEMAGVLQAKGIETEIFWIGKEPIQGCTACGACKKTGRCAFDRDGLNLCREKLAQADGLVLGSPVYYGAIAGGMKCFLDRLFYAGKPPRYKVGAAVCTLRRGGRHRRLRPAAELFAAQRDGAGAHPAIGRRCTATRPRSWRRTWRACRPCGRRPPPWPGCWRACTRPIYRPRSPEQPKRGTNFIR